MFVWAVLLLAPVLGQGPYTSCHQITTPCECTIDAIRGKRMGCGWSTQKGKCESARLSTTTCEECPTLNLNGVACDSRNCVASACPLYNALRTCQCTEDCASHGNCCADAGSCKCSHITNKCDCSPDFGKEFCGWSTKENKCVSRHKSQTTCEECDTLDNCISSQCVTSSCPAYDPLRKCQCNDDCAKYSNCCSNAGQCNPCQCKDVFGWRGKFYDQCAITSPFGKSWCYVKGGSSCTHATQSSTNSNQYYVQNCGHPCDCKSSFDYDGVTYNQCTDVDDDTKWCYVKDPENCAYATMSTDNPFEGYRYCAEKDDDLDIVIEKKRCTPLKELMMTPRGRIKKDEIRFQLKHQADAACKAHGGRCRGVFNRGCTSENGSGVEPMKFSLCGAGKRRRHSKHCILKED